MLESRRAVTVAAGQSGSGKSTFCVRYLLNAPLSVRFLFDPDPGEFHPDKGEFSDRLKLPPARDEFDLALGLIGGWVAFDPWEMFPGEAEAALEYFCEFAFEKSAGIPGSKILVVDEVWKYCSPQMIPHWLKRVVKEGRKRGLRLWVNIQEPWKLNSSIVSEVSEFDFFRLQLLKPTHADFVSGCGFDPAEISALAPLQYVARNMDSGGMQRGKLSL